MADLGEISVQPAIAFRIGIGAIITVVVQTVAVIAFLVQLRSDVNVLKERNIDQDKTIAVLQTQSLRLGIVEERQNRVLETLRDNAVTVKDNANKLDQLQRSIDRWGPAQNPPGPGYKLQSVDPPR